ncbi:MAG TPA: FAD-binding oxidoreductase, partial [Bryobacteraceae bacterium]|nr:FAD-binding oxidoreductase [Bryobacteraceae bacterium]
MTGEADKIWVPRTEDEVREILRQASREWIPVTISGAGTGVTGGRVAQGGWVLSLEKFTRIEIAEGRARVGAGVTLVALGAEAAKSGQFYAPDPTERTASIGGNIATNASGSRSFRYGSTRRHLLGLRVVLMDGTVYEYRRGEPIDFDVPAIPLPRTTKHSAGYPLQPGMDWVDLFCGSEGTL